MEAKAELFAMIDRMPWDEVLDLIDFISNKTDPDELTPEEMAAGEYSRSKSSRLSMRRFGS